MADLHPMGVGEILDGALTMYRRHFGLFAKVGVVAMWLPTAMLIYVELAGGTEQHLFLAIVAWVIGQFAGLFLTAAAIRIISDSYLGRTSELAEALSLGASKIWPLLVVGLGKFIILFLLSMVVGVVASVTIPALAASGGGAALIFVLLAFLGACWLILFVMCGYAVTTPVVVLETLGGSFDAFGRSWDLTRSFKFKIFAIWFVAFLMIYLPIIALGALGGWFSLTLPLIGHVIQIVSAALPIVMYPIFSCILTLIYYDLRVRREAFDLQILGQQLGIS
ncbi:MAG TPA: hypothetical protein VGQ18_08665 [Gemmatimonadales bacterium]|jgi:hypothetical protein|nr:hypothetical protein [Gemmatimonadales bacterium]